MTNRPTSPAAHNAPKTGSKLTTLDPSAGYITIINTYAVSPEHAEAFVVRGKPGGLLFQNLAKLG